MQHNLTKGSITSSILLFAFPMILGNLLQQCYNIADTLIVGRFLGANALAAVGSAYTLMTFLTSIFYWSLYGKRGFIFHIFWKERHGRTETFYFSLFYYDRFPHTDSQYRCVLSHGASSGLASYSPCGSPYVPGIYLDHLLGNQWNLPL